MVLAVKPFLCPSFRQTILRMNQVRYRLLVISYRQRATTIMVTFLVRISYGENNKYYSPPM